MCGDSFESERISNTDFQVMACENESYISPGKRKTGNNSVSVEAAEVREMPCALAAIASSKRSSPNDAEENKKAGDEEYPTTPKSEKHKIPVMTCCPPAPRKPRLTLRKRKPAIPSGSIYIPFDLPDLDLLFGTESKSVTQHMKKKQKKIEEWSI